MKTQEECSRDFRLAEQRVGRVDRLDSPHAEVSVYYPDDHADFALRADEKFFERHHLVAELLGANIPLPELTRRLEVEKGRVIHVETVPPGLRPITECRAIQNS